MADDRSGSQKSGPGTDDTTEYSSSKAPETRAEAEERAPQPNDPRLIPGGARGMQGDTGMSALDRDAVPNGAVDPGLQDFGAVDETSTRD